MHKNTTALDARSRDERHQIMKLNKPYYEYVVDLGWMSGEVSRPLRTTSKAP